MPEQDTIQDIIYVLGTALGYGVDEKGRVLTGDLTVKMLADEAANAIASLKVENRDRRVAVREFLKRVCDRHMLGQQSVGYEIKGEVFHP